MLPYLVRREYRLCIFRLRHEAAHFSENKVLFYADTNLCREKKVNVSRDSVDDRSRAFSSDRIQAIDVTMLARLYLDRAIKTTAKKPPRKTSRGSAPLGRSRGITYAGRARAGTRDPCERERERARRRVQRGIGGDRPSHGFNGAWRSVTVDSSRGDECPREMIARFRRSDL